VTIDDQRAAFEAWAKHLHLDTEQYSAWILGEYVDYRVNIAWRAWQAAIEWAKTETQ